MNNGILSCIFFLSELHHAYMHHCFSFEDGETEVNNSKIAQQTRGRSENSVSHVTTQPSKTPF